MIHLLNLGRDDFWRPVWSVLWVRVASGSPVSGGTVAVDGYRTSINTKLYTSKMEVYMIYMGKHPEMADFHSTSWKLWALSRSGPSQVEKCPIFESSIGRSRGPREHTSLNFPLLLRQMPSSFTFVFKFRVLRVLAPQNTKKKDPYPLRLNSFYLIQDMFWSRDPDSWFSIWQLSCSLPPEILHIIWPKPIYRRKQNGIGSKGCCLVTSTAYCFNNILTIESPLFTIKNHYSPVITIINH